MQSLARLTPLCRLGIAGVVHQPLFGQYVRKEKDPAERLLGIPATVVHPGQLNLILECLEVHRIYLSVQIL